MNPRNLAGVVIVLLLLLAVVVAESSKKPATSPVKIGAALALTGDAASWGEPSRNAVLMAVEEVNTEGGIKGRPLEVVVEDMQSTSKGSVSAVSKLINVDKVEAIVGPTWLDSYQGAAELVKTNNIILISPDAGIEAVNGDRVQRNAFSTWYRTDVKAHILSDYIVKAGIKKLGQIYQNDPYYTDFAKRVKKYTEAQGVQLVDTELINSGITDIRTPTLKLKASGADAIVVGLYEEKALFNFLKLRQELFPTLQLFGDETIHDHYAVPAYKGLLENTVYFYAAAPDKNFVTKYVAKYHTDPAFGAASSYDAVMIIAKMFGNKGLGADYNGYLRTTTFPSVTYGSMTFDALGGVKTDNNQFDLWKIVNDRAQRI